MVHKLLSAGATVNLEMSTQGAAARRAAQTDVLQILTLLLSSGGALDQGTRLCHTALQIAAKNGHREVIGALLDAGADVAMLNNYGWTAGDLAIAWGYVEIGEMLKTREAKGFERELDERQPTGRCLK